MIKISLLSFIKSYKYRNNYNLKKTYKEFYIFFLFLVCFFLYLDLDKFFILKMPTYLITGSNRGIGLELCRQIYKRGDNVIATCRKASKELRDLGVRIEENLSLIHI